MCKKVFQVLVILFVFRAEMIEIVFYYCARDTWTQISLVQDVVYASMYCVVFGSIFFCLDKWILKRHYIQKLLRRISLPIGRKNAMLIFLVILCGAAMVFEGCQLYKAIRDNLGGLWGIQYVFAIYFISNLLATAWNKISQRRPRVV